MKNTLTYIKIGFAIIALILFLIATTYLAGFIFLLISKTNPFKADLYTYYQYWHHYYHVDVFYQKRLHIAGILSIMITLGIPLVLFISSKNSAEKLKLGQASNTFGSATWADKKDLVKMGAYDKQSGIPSALDTQGKLLYFPLKNKLTLSPQGGGKTTCSSIPMLLSYNGPVFVFDVKGELWATTARYRTEAMGRKVIVIDPYRLRQQKDFKENRPKNLLKEHYFNPFDWIPENQFERDRMINAFAASFVINDTGGSALHFNENARILIRGYIDYMMKVLPKEERRLETLFNLLSEHQADAAATFQEMSLMQGRAAAASNQINRVGSDERGSILSTSYRQIDWMSDSNMQRILSKSNFKLTEFLEGNMDIFIILPEDQVKEQSRLVRMLMSLLMSMIIQVNPAKLPQQKMLFLLEELAQLGYCPDVEQAIEVLRGRGVVVWTVFQTLSQIELFSKPDLFKSAAIKQIFTIDDVKTMEWIQTLSGKKTVITQSYSTNTGDTHQKMELFTGNRSTGKSESYQEIGVDLIPINEIREMPYEQQLIFIQGEKPIKCKKLFYFHHEIFKNKY